MGKIIGIDLGTTNSVVCVIENGEPKVIANEEGARTTPSVVAVKSGDTLVGQIAKRQATANPEGTVFSAKRFIGARFDEAKNEISRTPFKCVKSGNGGVAFKLDGKDFTPEEISAKVLQKLKRAAEKYLGEEVVGAVITVPAYFNDSQRQATRDAGKIAGLEVKRIVNEPTAAAMAYGLGKESEEKVAVFDFGGGTFDISILEVGEDLVEVISTNGDTRLGGDDVDDKIMDYLIEEFKSDTGIDLSKDSMALQRLKEAAEKAKIELSSASQTEVNLPFVTADATGPKHLNVMLSRSKFEQLIDDIVKRTMKPVEAALKDAKLKTSDINEVIMVGGSTRIPAVQKAVSNFFGKEPSHSVNPDEVVALGAAVQAGVLSGDVKDLLLLDVMPLSLGIETMGGITTVLLERNTTIPTKKTEVFSTASDNQGSVEVHVLQGERTSAKDNRTLGRFHLDGLPPAPRGVPQIEVTFDVDANGIINVSAKDRGTNKEQNITITSSAGLSDSDIERMVEEAKENAEADAEKRKVSEARNKLDTLTYQTEKMLGEENASFKEEDVANARETLAEARQLLDTEHDFESINSMSERLSQAAYKLSETMYAAKQDQEDSTIDEDFVDAEVVD